MYLKKEEKKQDSKKVQVCALQNNRNYTMFSKVVINFLVTLF